MGIVKYPLKQPAELGSFEFGDELLDFNKFCAANDNVQQYPYGYVIPKEEYLNGNKRISHIICMSHDYGAADAPEIVPQGEYLVLKKNIRCRFGEERSMAYSLIDEHMREKGLSVAGDTYEIPVDIPEFMRSSDHFHVLFMVRVEGRGA